jgi:hypothetical protein
VVSGIPTGGNLFSFLQNKGELEKEIVKKGMKKGQMPSNN